MKNIDLNLLKDSDTKLLKNWILLQEKIQKGEKLEFKNEIISTLRDDLYGRFVLEITQYRNELMLGVYGKASIFDDYGKKHGWIKIIYLLADLPKQTVYVLRASDKVDYTRYLKLLAEFVFLKPADFYKVTYDDGIPACQLRKTIDFEEFTPSEKRQLGHFEGIFNQFKNVEFYEDGPDARFRKVDRKRVDMTLAKCEKRYQALKGMAFKRRLIGECCHQYKTKPSLSCDFCGRPGKSPQIDILSKVWGVGRRAIACDFCLKGSLKAHYEDKTLFVKDGDSYYFAHDTRLKNKKFHTRGKKPAHIASSACGRCFH